MLLTLVLILNILRKSSPNPQFQFIQNGSIVHAVEASALIVRDEAVLTAPVDGAVKPLTSEGIRVSANNQIAMVIKPGMESTIADLENCEQQITEIQMELMDQGNAAAAKAVYDEADAEIASLVRLVRKDSADGILTNTGLYASSLDLLIEGRENRMMTVGFKDARLDQLASQRAYYSALLGENAGTITSPSPGIVSYRLDGLEDKLTPATLPKITLEQYRSYLASLKGYASVPSPVAAGVPIARISNGLVQYLVIFVDKASTAWFEPGSLHSVSITGEGIVLEDCVVVSAAAAESGVFLTLSSDRQVARLFDRRAVGCSITVPSLTVSGLKLPARAITREDGTAWIMVIHSGFARKAEVRILDEDRSHAVVEVVGDNPYGVKASTIVIVNPESVTEGEQVG